MGSSAQSSSTASSATATRAPEAAVARIAVSQRPRVRLWVQASLCVPVSKLRGHPAPAGRHRRGRGRVLAPVLQAAKVGLGVNVADLPDYASVNVYGTAMLLAAMVEHDIFAKLQVADRAEAIVRARQAGMGNTGLGIEMRQAHPPS
ncbi:hypothetical protein [Nonomuraea sp. 10N515B]|uniref:hypothetical protein n=1 Tax=Nonomuraea sp. 10N515B TaxID=3457422 RepID=UPI003FCCECDC